MNYEKFNPLCLDYLNCNCSSPFKTKMHASFAEIDSKFKENWRKEYGFLSVFYFNVFIASASFSIVLPSLWPYLNSFDLPEIYLAIVLFAFSFGEATGALAFGHTHNKLSTKTTLFIVMGIGLAGSILYFLASYFEKYYFITTLILARCF